MARCVALLLLCVVLVSGIASTAKAVLLSVDDPIHGLDSITRDTDTGLDWLDVPLSERLNFDDAVAETGPGGAFEGFRHAVRSELEVLVFVSAKVSEVNPAATLPELLALIDLVGRTSVARQTFGLYDDSEDGTFEPNAGRLILEGDSGGQVFFQPDTQSRDEQLIQALIGTGSWLVRATPSKIPEPKTGALVVTALVLCAFFRWRFHSKLTGAHGK